MFPSPATPSDDSGLGVASDGDDHLVLQVVVDNPLTGDRILRCRYDFATGTLGWLEGVLRRRYLAPEEAVAVIWATHMTPTHASRLLTNPSRRLSELWDECTTSPDDHDATTLFLFAWFSSTGLPSPVYSDPLLLVEVRHSSTGDTILTCQYDPNYGTVGWLVNELRVRDLIPFGVRTVNLWTTPSSTRAPRALTDPSRRLSELRDEEARTLIDRGYHILALNAWFFLTEATPSWCGGGISLAEVVHPTPPPLGPGHPLT